MGKNKTSLSDLYDYMKNNLTKERMKEVGKSIRENGEVEMLFHQLMFDNLYNEAYVNSLIGPDEEKNEKKEDENLTNSEDQALYRKQTRKTNLKNDEIMATLDEMNVLENMGKVQQAVEALRPDIEEMMASGDTDFKAYGQKRLVEHYGITEEAAKKIVDELLEGIRMFDEQFDASKNGDPLFGRIEEALKGKTEEEKKALMVQSLAALQVLKSGEEADEEILQDAQEAYEQMSYEELAITFERTIKEGDCFDCIVDSMMNTRQPLNAERMDALRELLEERGDAYKFYVALAIYMGHCDEKIDLSVDEAELDPKVIGASAAAAIKLAVGPGKDVDEATWRAWAKFVFGLLLTVLISFLCCALVAIAAITVGVGLMMLFGQGIISAFIALGAAAVVFIYGINKSEEFMSWSLEALEEPYDRAVEYLVVRFHKLKEWLAKKRNTSGSAQMVDTERQTSDHVHSEEQEVIDPETQTSSRGRTRGLNFA